MAKLNQIYKCNVCGNMVELVNVGAGQLVCCGQPMEELEEKTTDPEISIEKHVPVIEKTVNGFKVKVGAEPHPMEQGHYIQWIELVADNQVYRQYLRPEFDPEAEFCIDGEIIMARIYCNLHGLWKS